ncbi:hypothetical protein ASPZODRAFT_130780 [Penicilliopsis zonata CBS 506.65]|uniref:Arabinan endo-1,5-alpha-L-arabinosidase n=1 Tax=Penicilliopsis zonata CBS 506.65 TaxID=1073090 RepID=A0A1L9SN34_9EURO|nr:hypothetical protein ASPZODRAFT_130780 [Penicilliopsis zonata CBS 506.65]OJJ48672.1 hypothetical protein ASPZODRAFT_130780 [Penicilliopsis zonata CBS 506.65]
MRFLFPLSLALACLCEIAAVECVKISSDVFPKTDIYPAPNQGNLHAHDPSIIKDNGSFYLFKGGHYLPIYKAPSLSGPWTNIGTVFSGPSIIHKVNRTRPWSPMTTLQNGTYYCYYAISANGITNSAIGVATATSLENSTWTDHGAIINTGSGYLSDIWPYSEANAIDPAFMRDQSTGKPYLTFGSYWHDIFLVALSEDLLSVENPTAPDAINTAYQPKPYHGSRPLEGSFLSYKSPFYYLWFSHGQCCHFGRDNFPEPGHEYSIRVGRSTSIRGPFVDKDGVHLTEGGGTVIYGSNRGVTYAPGGIGVMAGNQSYPDILYFHYLNTSTGFKNKDAHLGWEYLDYDQGWPVAKATFDSTEFTLNNANYTSNVAAFNGQSRSKLAFVVFFSALMYIVS